MESMKPRQMRMLNKRNPPQSNDDRHGVHEKHCKTFQKTFLHGDHPSPYFLVVRQLDRSPKGAARKQGGNLDNQAAQTIHR